MRRTVFAVLALATLASACSSGETAPPEPQGPAFGTFGIDLANMDTTVAAGEDFFRYVNGRWLASFKIPEDKPGYGAFYELIDRTDAEVRAVVEGLAATKPANGTVQQKVLDLYRSWMDTAAVEARGTEPLKAEIDRIRAATSKADIVKLMGSFDFAAPFSTTVEADLNDPTIYSVHLCQSGLGMPNRDYYLRQGADYDRYRAAYKTYVAKILELIGDAAPAAGADRILALETKLANVHWAPERTRDVKATNNPVDRAGLVKMVPAMDWEAFLAARELDGAQGFIVHETTAIRDGAKLLDQASVDDWKTYLAFHLASDYARDLPSAFDNAYFDFFGKQLSGTQQQEPRWKRGVGLLNGMIGEGAGQLYVEKYFPPASKTAMDALVKNLLTAMGQRIQNLTWMDDSTRAEAQKKLASFDPMIGYPDKWRDYSKLAIEPGKLFENVRAARRFEWERNAVRAGKPVDRREWWLPPQIVNAYYDPSKNQIVFPAGILQPPFFDPMADPAVNYGAIGAVIGHEIGHGFDDQGREFDGTGKVRNWWTAATSKRFTEATSRFGKQYEAICPLAGLCINGQLTMGENIGDLGGLEMAYAAYRMSLAGKEAPVLGGFSGDQRFFLSHAQVWRWLDRDDALRQGLLVDPHSPPLARASVPERNMDAWYQAFGVKESNKLFIAPEQRVHIW